MYYLLSPLFFFHILFNVADFCCDMCVSGSGNCYQPYNDSTAVLSHTIYPSATQDSLFLLPVFWAITIISVSFHSSYLLSDQLHLKTDMKSKTNIFPVNAASVFVFALNQIQHLAIFSIPSQTVNADRIYLIENEVNVRPLHSVIFH